LAALALAGCGGYAAVDRDADGFPEADDCDDANAAVYPGAPEICDGLDNDCNGVADDAGTDADADGVDDCADPTPDGFDGAAGRETPLSMQLHLHGSLSECNGTMAYHNYQAEQYGVDVLWWSDHDNMISMTMRLPGYDFDCGGLACITDTPTTEVLNGFWQLHDGLAESTSEVVEGGVTDDGYYWQIEGQSDVGEEWQRLLFAYSAIGIKSHQMPLMADVTVTLALRSHQPVHDDWQLRISVILSFNLDEMPNTITYFAGGEDLTGDTNETELYLRLEPPMVVDEWTDVELPLTADATLHFFERDDLAALSYLVELRSRNGAAASLDVDDLRFSWQREGDELWQYQKQVVADRYSFGDVTHFVGTEITHVEEWRHINPFGVDDVPLLDYPELGLVPANEAVQHVHDHGNIAQCNHPFGSVFVVQHEGLDADMRAEQLATDWIEKGAYGCDVLEVGYLQRVVDLDHHLMFWDLLGEAGLYLTGTGVSDHHWVSDWLEFSNPFQTWIFLDVPSRAGIADALQRGRAFFGHPAPFVGQEALLDLWCEHGAVMGQVLQTDLPLPIHVETGYIEPGWWLELVVDGEVHERRLLAGDEVDSLFEVERVDHYLVRAQIRDADEEIILLSNPLYLVMPGDAADVPAIRLAP